MEDSKQKTKNERPWLEKARQIALAKKKELKEISEKEKAIKQKEYEKRKEEVNKKYEEVNTQRSGGCAVCVAKIKEYPIEKEKEKEKTIKKEKIVKKKSKNHLESSSSESESESYSSSSSDSEAGATQYARQEIKKKKEKYKKKQPKSFLPKARTQCQQLEEMTNIQITKQALAEKIAQRDKARLEMACRSLGLF